MSPSTAADVALGDASSPATRDHEPRRLPARDLMSGARELARRHGPAVAPTPTAHPDATLARRQSFGEWALGATASTSCPTPSAANPKEQ